MTRFIPSFNLSTLKLINSPTLIFSEDSACPVNTGGARLVWDDLTVNRIFHKSFDITKIYLTRTRCLIVKLNIKAGL